MADGPRDDDDPEHRLTEEAALSARLRRLGNQLDRERASEAPETAPGAQPVAGMSGFARGFRLSTELVAGVLVGAVIGWSIDHWVGTSPWGMIVFLLLGFAAGVFNVMRAAGVMPSASGEDSAK